MKVAALCLGTLAPPAEAGELRPLEAGSIELGGFRGVVYYTSEDDGYRVVATLAEGEGLPVRFVGTLAESQSLTISVPGHVGEPDQEIEVSRVGDKLAVSRPSAVDMGRNIRLQALGK
jgi:hypothetical protein